MSIHTIGDSHTNFYMSEIIQHHIPQLLCYSFGKEKLGRIDLRNINLQNGDTIIFCLGEIDCRCHIHKHINEKKSFEKIIDEIINDYFDAIKINIENLSIKLKHICVYNVLPPVQKHNTDENSNFPFLGTDNERKNYVLYFNRKIKEKCFENNYIFFDIYDKYVDNNGFLCKKLSDGSVHIGSSIYVREFINKNNLW